MLHPTVLLVIRSNTPSLFMLRKSGKATNSIATLLVNNVSLPFTQQSPAHISTPGFIVKLKNDKEVSGLS